MNKEKKIENLIKATHRAAMPKTDDFYYTRLSSKLETRNKHSLKKRVIIGAGILAINSLVLFFTFNKEKDQEHYSFDQAAEYFASAYEQHVNFGLNERK